MRKHYKLDVKVQALAVLDASRGSLWETALMLNIPRQTLSDWHCKREIIYERYHQALDRQGLGLTEQMELLVRQLVAALPSKVEGAKLGETVKALSAVMDLQKRVAAQEEAHTDYREKVYDKLQRLYEAYQAETMEEAPEVVMLPERTRE